MLQQLAPRIWQSANTTIDTVMANDLGLHLPFAQHSQRPPQPTAFSQVEYRFSIEDSHPIQSLTDDPTSWTAFTSVGHYNSAETALILWHDKCIVSFPLGSTFIMPGGIVSFSFTGVPDYSPRMLISQSSDGELFRYVNHGMTYRPDPTFTTQEEWDADRRSRVGRAIAMFPTLNEYDSEAGYA
jgi:hypothetical protein